MNNDHINYNDYGICYIKYYTLIHIFYVCNNIYILDNYVMNAYDAYKS